MTQLSKLAILGIAPENPAAVGTYVAPTAFIPFMKADWEDIFGEIKDESYRANDTVLQGLYQGPAYTTWAIDQLAYPDTCGIYLRAIIGPDTVTAGVSTTLAAAVGAVGATTISTTATIPTGTAIKIDTGTDAEYAITGVPSGAGPYTIPISSPTGGLAKTHLNAVAVVGATKHVFKQNPAAAKATYSLTVFDTVGTIGYTGAVLSDLQIKIDPKGACTLSSKWSARPAASQSAMTPAYAPPPPLLGWQWFMTNAGAASTRGLTYDVSIKRSVDVIHSSDGLQAPREIFQGALEVDGAYKAIFENNTDLNLYLNNTQSPASALLQQPAGGDNVGAALTLLLSKSGWNKGKRDLGSQYVQASFSLSGIYNATDGGAIAATLMNFQTSAY